MKILFLVPYPSGQAPSQRFRFEQYFESLAAKGHQVVVRSFLDQITWEALYQSGGSFTKLRGVVRGFLRRMRDLFTAARCDLVFIHREASPVGPPVFEWFIARVLGKKYIYDFDDAIWLPNTSRENKIAAFMKYHSKVRLICKWAWKVSCGNQFLVDFAQQYANRVVLNPTTIDTANLHTPQEKSPQEAPVIGWTGTHSTIKYLEGLLPVFRGLEQHTSFRLLVISNHPPQFSLPSMEFRKWDKTREVEDLAEMDLGLMPLADDEWAQGKCGFKSLQYMSLEIPALVSPVGVNHQMVADGVTGYHCRSDEEWRDRIIELLKAPAKREEMGKAGRQYVIDHYSVKSNTRNFVSLFEDSTGH